MFGQRNCGEIDKEPVDTKCQVEWLDSMPCPRASETPTGYWNGDDVGPRLKPSESPNGIKWEWFECAQRCAMSDE